MTGVIPAKWISDGYNRNELSSIHKWQEMCPVHPEGLLQLTLGASMHVSHGGLQHARDRYYDATARRPGLPPGVSALMEKLTNDSMTRSRAARGNHAPAATMIV